MVEAAAVLVRLVAGDRRRVERERHVVAVDIDAAAVVAGQVVRHLAAVLEGDRAAVVADIDATARALGVVVHHVGVAEHERGVLAVDGDARAVAVAAVELVGQVAGDGDVVEVHLTALALGGDAARAIVVVAGAARDEAAAEHRLARAVELPERRGDVAVGVGVDVGEGACVGGLGLLPRAAVHRERAAVLHVDGLALPLGVPGAAVGAGLVGVEHVAVQVDGVGLALGHHDAPMGVRVPVAVQVDGDARHRGVCAEGVGLREQVVDARVLARLVPGVAREGAHGLLPGGIGEGRAGARDGQGKCGDCEHTEQRKTGGL